MARFMDLTGKQFGGMIVLERAENKDNGNTQWLCECTYCGNTKVVCGSTLRSGSVKSCGCMTKQFYRESMGYKEKPVDIKVKVAEKLKELRKIQKEISVSNESTRLKYYLISSQIAILESLSPEFEKEGEILYRKECRDDKHKRPI